MPEDLRVAESPLDAIILAGDNFYPCGVTSDSDPRWSLVRAITSIGVPVFPVLGAGSASFRGGLTPNAVQEFARKYPGYRTVTVQSAFRYDYPEDEVREGVAPRADPERSHGRRPPSTRPALRRCR